MRFLARPRAVVNAVLNAETAAALPAQSTFTDFALKFGSVTADDFLGAWVVEVNDDLLPAWNAALPVIEGEIEVAPARRLYAMAPAPAPPNAIPASFTKLGLEDVWNLNVHGKDIDVGVIDVGFSIHSCLKSAVKSHKYYDDKTRSFKDGGFPGNKFVQHGTFAAALIAGAAINGSEISVATGARLHLVELPGDAFENDLSKAVQFLVGQKCRVISISLGTWEPAPFLDVPLKKARNANVLTVAAIGNDGKGVAMWPGACSQALSVGFCDEKGELPSKSGSTIFDRSRNPLVPLVVAPGILLTSAQVGGTTCQSSGSSFAAPLVAGIAALLLSDSPSATANCVEKAILDTCVRLSTYQDRCEPGVPSAIEALKLLRVMTAC